MHIIETFDPKYGVLICWLCVGFVTAQNQVLRVVSKLQPQPDAIPTTLYQFTDQSDSEMVLKNTKTIFSNAEGICARGIWVLYTEQSWGEGLEGTTTVISMLSQNTMPCYPVAGGVLKKVRSLNSLGNRGDISKPGLTIFTQPFFLGGLWDLSKTATPGSTIPVQPSGGAATGPPPPSGMTLGSFAVTGGSNVRLCVDSTCTSTGSVCIDMSKSATHMFMVKNVQADRSADRPWPIVIRAVSVLMDNVPCPDGPKIVAN